MNAATKPVDWQNRRAELCRHLEQEGISDPRVLQSMARTPREAFVPEDEREYAYADAALAIAHHQTISQPYIVALMTQALQLTGGERVLEIGTGSGYQAAILAPLCRTLVTIERIPELSDSAREVHRSLGYENILHRVGDGTLGCPELAPYDAIIVTAAAPEIPEPLIAQLKLGGRLVVPVGGEDSQDLLRVTRTPEGAQVESLTGCRFVKLIGAAGWAEPDEVN